MIHTHCHVYEEEMSNYKDIIKKCLNKNINLIINSVNIKTSKEVIKLSKKYNNVYASIGLNYDEVENINEKDFIKLERLINKNNIIAIGEIGLDYYWTKDNKDKQKYIFEKQLKLAEEYNLPVIIHARNSIQDVYDILKKYNLKGSMHCFQGSLEMAKKFISLGFKIGIDGPITYKNNKKQIELINNLDLKDILVETDSPYLTPEPNRGKKNNPTNLIYIINKIAEIKKETPEKVIEETTKNTKEIFNI